MGRKIKPSDTTHVGTMLQPVLGTKNSILTCGFAKKVWNPL